MTWQHRTIQNYVSAVIRAGLVVEALSECPPERSLFDGDDDEFARRLRTPFSCCSPRGPARKP